MKGLTFVRNSQSSVTTRTRASQTGFGLSAGALIGLVAVVMLIAQFGAMVVLDLAVIVAVLAGIVAFGGMVYAMIQIGKNSERNTREAEQATYDRTKSVRTTTKAALRVSPDATSTPLTSAERKRLK